MSEVLSTSVLVILGLILCRRYDPSINLDWMDLCYHLTMLVFLICSFMGLRSAIIQQLHWTAMLNQHNNRSAYGHFLKKYLPTIPLYPNKVSKIILLGSCPTWRTNSFQCIYLFIVLYMFRACHAHHQEKQIVSIQLLVIVTPCCWQCRVLVGSLLIQSVSPDDEHDMLETCREL